MRRTTWFRQLLESANKNKQFCFQITGRFSLIVTMDRATVVTRLMWQKSV